MKIKLKPGLWEIKDIDILKNKLGSKLWTFTLGYYILTVYTCIFPHPFFTTVAFALSLSSTLMYLSYIKYTRKEEKEATKQ